MADFCSLCGYNDIDIETIYNTHIKPIILEVIKTLKDDCMVSVGGICEHCGIVNIGVNNKYEVTGGYYEESQHQFGVLNKETLELEIFEDDSKYNQQRLEMKLDFSYVELELELEVIGEYKFVHNKTFDELTDEDFTRISSIYKTKLAEKTAKI